MKLRHLFEFGDQPWLPVVLRNLQTDFLNQMGALLHIYAPTAPLIEKLLTRMPARHIVDLCAGAAGPWQQLLERGWDVTVTLTDRYPHAGAMAAARQRFPQQITYCADSVDARHLPAWLGGTLVMFNSFHHFQAEDALTILREASGRGAAIGIFEIAERTPRTVLSVLVGVPLLVFALAPRIRPMTWSRLFWTYGVPLVPVMILWDGLVSVLRAYSPGQLDRLAAAAGGSDYQWETGRIVPPFPGVPVTYLIGYPDAPPK